MKSLIINSILNQDAMCKTFKITKYRLPLKLLNIGFSKARFYKVNKYELLDKKKINIKNFNLPGCCVSVELSSISAFFGSGRFLKSKSLLVYTASECVVYERISEGSVAVNDNFLLVLLASPTCLSI